MLLAGAYITATHDAIFLPQSWPKIEAQGKSCVELKTVSSITYVDENLHEKIWKMVSLTRTVYSQQHSKNDKKSAFLL
jgi:hypothetical protein